MNFLEASRIVRTFEGGAPLPFVLAMSGTANPLELYIRAEAARRGRSADPRLLPFNTLGQALLAPASEPEVFVLMPWDLVASLDWRSGVPFQPADAEACRAEASLVAARLAARPQARLLYLPAAVPPVFGDPAQGEALSRWLEALVRSIGARVLAVETFSLAGYLSSGCPIGGAALGSTAECIVDALLTNAARCKVLVTDLDNVMWSGVVGEDGVDGIAYAPEGVGFRHFVYQTLLRRLKHEGVLLAAVSRNDPEIALAPFRRGQMPLREEDFIAIVASYHAKSAQIRELAERLNLGLDAFVFVDDNPIELAEVATELAAVHCVRFPAATDGLPSMLDEITRLFASRTVTSEDRERTDLYRRRLAGMAPSDAAGADLRAFLSELDMELVVHDRTTDGRARAVQLINKTNQFNLNGRRFTDEEVGAMLATGGRLYTASLADRHGAHGEILACLVSGDDVIESLVLSCRVFQRRVEHAFLLWLGRQEAAPRLLRFSVTDRNEPIRQFLAHAGFSARADDLVELDHEAFAAAAAESRGLHRLVEPAPAVGS